MAVTAYLIISGKISDIGTLVGASISAGNQPFGPPIYDQDSELFFQPMIAGSQVLVGATGAAGSNGTNGTGAFTSTNAITAFAGGGQASATALTASPSLNRITTVGTAGDSVKLPAATAGSQIVVLNTAANSCNVFPATGEVINALTANTAIALAGTKSEIFYCAVAGTWNTLLSA